MRLGDVANAGAAGAGKPLDGVRILALEQMQALPYATQLLARLGAEVVKVEHPKGGDLGRGSLPAMADPEGRSVGATFLRNNLDKRSICIDLKSPAGPRPRAAARARGSTSSPRTPRPARWRGSGLGYDDIAAVHPGGRSTCRSPGFGNTDVAVALRRVAGVRPDRRGHVGHLRVQARGRRAAASSPPVGALGDIGSGPLRRHRRARRAAPPRRHRPGPARRHRHARRHGRHDRPRHQLLVARPARRRPGAADHGRLPGRRRLVHRPGRPRAAVRRRSPSSSAEPGWLDDPRFADRQGWVDHLEDVHPPGRRGLGGGQDPPRGVRGAVGGRHRGRARASPTTRWWPTRTSPPATCSWRCPAPTASTSRCSSPATR